MKIKLSVLAIMCMVLTGCGGGSDSASFVESGSTTQQNFQQETDDSQIVQIQLNDDTYIKSPIEDINLNDTSSNLTLSQSYSSNLTYESNRLSFVNAYYDSVKGEVVFSHELEYSDNSYTLLPLGYDFKKKSLVYTNSLIINGNLGPMVDTSQFSTTGSMNGVWESSCVVETKMNNESVLSETHLLTQIEISGENIIIRFYENCEEKLLYKRLIGKMKSKVMYSELSKRNVIVVKDVETAYGVVAPKRYLISANGQQMIKFYGSNSYVLFNKIN